MAHDPFHPRFPEPEPVEGRRLPVMLVEREEEEPPPERPAWVRWIAALLTLLWGLASTFGGLPLPG
ncbi:MAG TPA: hypothetical protein PLA94_18185 [Myxococcota bacterium]|nr:hypothetical protein [Myxococcota bacterium]